MIWLLIGFGLLEAVILSLETILKARGYAFLSAVAATLSVLLWFTVVKMAPDVAWETVPAYALAFGIGSYWTVRWTGNVASVKRVS